MGLRETESSLRVYFQLAGVVGLLIGATTILLGPGSGLAHWVPPIATLSEAAAFLWAGRVLPSALRTSTRGVEHILIGSGVLVFAEGAVVTAAGGNSGALHEIFGVGWDLIKMAIGLAITLYLYRSVVRLSTEARAREGLPTMPPTAQIV